MSKKSMPVVLAFVLILALATMGLGYGFWSDTLTINGTVVNGTLDAQWTNLWWSDTNCTYTLDSSNKTLTISATNAYPGFWCEGSVEVKNTGTIPVVVKPVVVTTSGPDYWDVYPYYTSAVTVQPGATGAGTGINFAVPISETGNEGATSTVTVVIDVKQVNEP